VNVETCTSVSVIQLLAVAFGFLLAVLALDAFWLRSANPHDDFEEILRKRGCLNAFVGMGAVGAAVLLWVWINTCTHGAL
jgi:hypothetical protein